MSQCGCYNVRIDRIYGNEMKYGVCLGTKEIDRCDCKGDESKCDFYPEKRKAAQKTLNTAEMWLKAQEDGKTYVSDYAIYSKTAGYMNRRFHDSTWGPSAWAHSEDNEDKKRELDNLMSTQWHEEVPTMTRAEAESKLGVKIVD